MVKPFKMNERKNYYFQVMIDGKRIVESTGETKYPLAVKKATERVNELRGKSNYQEALKRLIDCLNCLQVEERDNARNDCMEKINEGTIFKMKLEEAFSAYKERRKTRVVSEGTYKEYERLWNNFVNWLKKEYPEIVFLNEITVDVAEKYLASEWERGIAERTFNERIKKFRAMFSALSKKAGLFHNVWKSVDKMTEFTISKKPLTPEQLTDLFKVAKGEMKTLFIIGLYTGLRRGDASTLRWSEIDFDKRLIDKIPSKTKRSGKKVIIPLHGALKAILLSIKENLDDESKSEFVLPEIAEMYNRHPTSVGRIITRTFKKAGIETAVKREGAKMKTGVYGFHSFRHSFVSLCASGGIPIHVVMELVGHNSKLVHQIYQHATIEDKRKAIDLLPEVEG